MDTHHNQNSGPKNTAAKLLQQLLWPDLRVNRQDSCFMCMILKAEPVKKLTAYALKAQWIAALLRDIQLAIVQGFSINPSSIDVH